MLMKWIFHLQYFWSKRRVCFNIRMKLRGIILKSSQNKFIYRLRKALLGNFIWCESNAYINQFRTSFGPISCFLYSVKSDLIRFQRFKNSFLRLHCSWQGNQQFRALALVRSSLLYLQVDFHSNFLIRCLAAWLEIEKIRSSNHWFLRFRWKCRNDLDHEKRERERRMDDIYSYPEQTISIMEYPFICRNDFSKIFAYILD